MSYATAMHDRMLACLVIPCTVVAVDLAATRVPTLRAMCPRPGTLRSV